MTNVVEKFEKQQIDKLTSKKRIPAFRSGDTIKVIQKIVEGDRSRLQSFEGVCIARKNNKLNSSFTVRKISHGEGVEKVFSLFSPLIDKIEIVRKGDVRRAKLYYLRDRKGKSARIVDSNRGEEEDQYSILESEEIKSTNNNDSKDNSVKSNTETVKENVIEAEKEAKKESSNKSKEDPVAEEEKPIEEKSKSTASEADKTKDESKS